MKRSTEAGIAAGAAVGAFIKGLVMLVCTVGFLGYAIYLATQGEWVAAAVVAFVVEPIAMFVIDIVTGLLMALIAGMGAAAGAAIPERRGGSFLSLPRRLGPWR